MSGIVLCTMAQLTPCLGRADVTKITINPLPKPVTVNEARQEEEQVLNAPGGTSFTDDKAWSNQRATTIKDITDYIPGIIDQPHDGAESFRLSMRGSGLANTFQGRGLLIMQDGIPINMADGEFEFPVIDPWLIQYAAVYPGADALKYGSSTLGGAINFITPTGATENGYYARAEGGSFGTLHGQLAAGKTWNGGDIFASATGFFQQGFRDQNEQRTQRQNMNLGWQVSDHFANRIYASHTTADADIPGAISLAMSARNPEQANPRNLSGNYQRNLDITRLADQSVWDKGNDHVETTLYYTYRTLVNPVTTFEFQQNNDTGMRMEYTHQSGLNQWLMGFNHYYGNAGETRYQNNAAVAGSRILNRSLYAYTAEGYAQYQQHVAGALYAIGGMQTSYAMRDIHQGFPSIASQNESYRGFSPRIGLRYDMADGTQLFTNLSRSFEPPTWSELSGGNVPGFSYLRAQRATTAEVGGRGTQGKLHWQAAYYHSWLTNEFVQYRFADGDTATINAPRTRKDGIELGLDGDIKQNIWMKNDALVLRTAYTFSRFTLNHDPLYGNNTVPGVPEHYLRAEMLYRLASGISFGPNVEWSPTASPIDLANTLYADGYAIYGARAFWESPDQNYGIYLEGRNLANTNYIATYNVIPDASGHDGNYFYPGEGRAVYLGLKWKL
ncbi:MAG TPA: TonB-dependent receptor [Rickettsiales bacterium]|nr:TonB-dependent receptor [Rickettsiales bacterium]